MLRSLLAAALVAIAPAASAQEAGHHQMPGMSPEAPGLAATPVEPSEPGQAAFAAIQEIVSLLVADSATDWTKVDIEALRRHLIDMDNVTLRAEVTTTAIDGGLRFAVSGVGGVRDSIRRMVEAHAATMNGVGDLTILAEESPNGAIMTVVPANPDDLPKLRGLGFIGVMALGIHHQQHHLMIATGRGPHR